MISEWKLSFWSTSMIISSASMFLKYDTPSKFGNHGVLISLKTEICEYNMDNFPDWKSFLVKPMN